MLDPLESLAQFGLPAVVGLVAGSISGAFLASRGVRAATALEGRQPLAWAVVLLGGTLVWVLYTGRVQDLLPASTQPYADLVFHPGATLLATFVFAFLALLERRAWREVGQRRSLGLGLGITLILIGYLGWLSLPVGPTEDLSAEGVVFQTTPFTCAAASIATIGRATGVAPALTEGEAAGLARTTNGGTLASGELRALRELGLEARFGRRMSVDSLLAHSGFAILHVNEPLPGGRRIRHAVALLAVDSVTRTIRIGNPLEGIQEIHFDALDSYWIGEAVLVTVP
jgi:hypothetical protein